MMRPRVFLAMLVASLGLFIPPAFAQNWSGDARRIAMGGAGTGENLASSMVEEQETGYRTIVVPLGLFQVLKDLDIFNPDSDKFDLVRSIEYASSPLHYTHDRDGTGTGALFVNAIRNGEFSRDLNVYRGFVPVTQPVSYGLANPSFGGTIPVYKSDRVKHGIFVGAGPYLAFRGALEVDQQLIDILGSSTDVYLANRAIPVNSAVRGELALAITGGYRGRFASFGAGTNDRDGVYIAVNYNYLRGFVYEDADIDLRLDTDGGGLLTVNPSLPPPAFVARQDSSDGRGFSVDVGAAVVVNHWEIGGGVNGIANRIDWKDVERTDYALSSLFEGGEFVDSPSIALGDVRVEQPVEYTGNVAYRADRWLGLAQVSQRTSNNPADQDRFNRTTFRAGGEYRFGLLEPRGGAFYTRERWHPSAGLGLNFGGFGIDSAVYWTDANVQRERHAAFALSLRFGRRNGAE